MLGAALARPDTIEARLLSGASLPGVERGGLLLPPRLRGARRHRGDSAAGPQPEETDDSRAIMHGRPKRVPRCRASGYRRRAVARLAGPQERDAPSTAASRVVPLHDNPISVASSISCAQKMDRSIPPTPNGTELLQSHCGRRARLLRRRLHQRGLIFSKSDHCGVGARARAYAPSRMVPTCPGFGGRLMPTRETRTRASPGTIGFGRRVTIAFHVAIRTRASAIPGEQ